MLLGAGVNAIAILFGALVGRWMKGMKDHVSHTILQAIGLVIILIGAMMAFKTDKLFLVLISLVIGGAIGSILQIQDRLEGWSQKLEKHLGEGNQLASSFMTAVLVFCVGPMAILGGLDSGLRGSHNIYFTKSLLDGITAMIFSTTLGVGVLFSFIPVFLYEAFITVGSSWIVQFIPDQLLQLMITQMTAVGGIMIVAIGLNLLNILKIKVADFLPALFIVLILAPYIEY